MPSLVCTFSECTYPNNKNCNVCNPDEKNQIKNKLCMNDIKEKANKLKELIPKFKSKNKISHLKISALEWELKYLESIQEREMLLDELIEKIEDDMEYRHEYYQDGCNRAIKFLKSYKSNKE